MIHGDWIGRWGRSFPDKEALVDSIENRRYTYGELADEIHRTANLLRIEFGIAKGDRVACLSFNRSGYIKLFFALSRLGAILVPLNFRLAIDEFVYYLEDSSPTAMFFDREHLDRAEQLSSRVDISHWICLDDNPSFGRALPDLVQHFTTVPPPETEVSEDDPQFDHLHLRHDRTAQGSNSYPQNHNLEFHQYQSGMGPSFGRPDHSACSHVLHRRLEYLSPCRFFTVAARIFS